jgi:hypothetical protein
LIPFERNDPGRHLPDPALTRSGHIEKPGLHSERPAVATKMALESKAEILSQVLPTSMELIFIGRTTCDREKSGAVQDRLDGRKQ